MSICRWSSDDFSCDLYCYHDVGGGITVHIAANRVIGNIPKADMQLLLTGKDEDAKEYFEQHKIQMKFLDTAKHEPIKLPYAGESFMHLSNQEFYDKLIELRKLGYRFGDYVLDYAKELLKAERK